MYRCYPGMLKNQGDSFAKRAKGYMPGLPVSVILHCPCEIYRGERVERPFSKESVYFYPSLELPIDTSSTVFVNPNKGDGA